ncbi:unnamed protein product [Penicillium nalgiovense]|nr:unnamed protein product [Penicillium nalgiovense]
MSMLGMSSWPCQGEMLLSVAPPGSPRVRGPCSTIPTNLATWRPLTVSFRLFVFKVSYVTILNCHKITTSWSMNQMRHPFSLRSRGICWVSRRAFSGTTRAQACHTEKKQCPKSVEREIQLPQTPKCAKKLPSQPLSALSLPFWTCRSTWERAGINTLRCLVGCTAGDFSSLWILQTYYPDMGMGSIMALSMASGITTSVILETILLRRGADQLSWPMAARTAMGMSMVSMLAMELAENAVDYHLTGGIVAFGDPKFWLAAVVSIGAGYLAPLPYNYLRLRKYGKSCH